MSLIQQLKQAQDFTEREKDIARFVLEHPETIENMSSRELGHQTFTSAASVTRFCQKLGVKGLNIRRPLKICHPENWGIRPLPVRLL